MPSGVASAIGCAVAAIAATGCRSAVEGEKEIDTARTRDRELSRRPVSRTASPAVALPGSGRSKSARVEVVWERLNEGGQGGTALTVADWLVLTSEQHTALVSTRRFHLISPGCR